MPFDVHEEIYNIKVRKERRKTYFYGEQLAQLIVTRNLKEGDMPHISVGGPQPSIKLVYMGQFVEEENESDGVMSEEENESDDAMSEEDDPWKYVVVGQRADPTEREKDPSETTPER